MEESCFGVTCRDLKNLMSLSVEDSLGQLDELGGDKGLINSLNTDATQGVHVTVEDTNARQREFGRNFIPAPPPQTFLALAWEALQDKTLIALIVCAILSVTLGVSVEEDNRELAWIDGAAILGAVVIVVVVAAGNDYSKEKKFRALQDKLEGNSTCLVIRDGEPIEVLTADVLVGDIIKFKFGNVLPADGILLQGHDVKIDESTLTGESVPRKKTVENDRLLYGGTHVNEGEGHLLVLAVGPNSRHGIILLLLSQREEEVGFITAWFRRMKKRVFKHEDVTPSEEDGLILPEPSPDDGDKENNTEEEPGKDLPRVTWCYCLFRPWLWCGGNDALTTIAQEQKKQQKKKGEGEEQKKSSSEGTSVLQKKLNRLAVKIGYGGTIAAVLCFFLLVIRFGIEFGVHNREWDHDQHWEELLHFAIIAITVLVVAVPEGLPLAVTIALAYSVQRMLKDNNLVRHLDACETMGNATTICSDKTGTLTLNRMTVVEAYLAGKIHKCGTDNSSMLRELPHKLLELLQHCIILNCSYSSRIDEAPDAIQYKSGGWIQWFKNKCCQWQQQGDHSDDSKPPARQLGNVTECALLQFLQSIGYDYAQIRKEHPESQYTAVYTFNGQRKRMSSVYPVVDGIERLMCKGAPEVVLQRCDYIMNEQGNVQPLTDEDKKWLLEDVVGTMASKALRTLCLAYRDLPHDQVPNDWEGQEATVVDHMTCVGVVGIQDPVRPEVPDCIRSCQEAGVTVRMVTGDNHATAKAIAVQCGIIGETSKSRYEVMTGTEFNEAVRDNTGKVVDGLINEVWPMLRVLARSTPEDKYTLVDGIIRSRVTKNREVVAVTGDGTNDGPALKRADVGFAMGQTGTDVAKNACDIILTDDNFSSIVKAVKWGRNVYDSISKFIQFQLTVNIVAVVLVLTAAVTITDSPLSAVQLLWVNLIMDTLASLALATEQPTDELLKRKPYGRTKPLISTTMWRFMVGHAIYQLIILFVLLYAGHNLFDIQNGKDVDRDDQSQHFTIVFNTFVFLQIGNEINARKVHGERNVFKGFFANFIFLGVMVIQIAVQTVIVQVEVLGIVFSTDPLELDQWLWCIFLGLSSLLWGQILILIPSRFFDVGRLYVKICYWRHSDKSTVGGAQASVTDDVLSDIASEPDPWDTDEPNRARILWVKNLTRLRHQIRVINAFRAGLGVDNLQGHPSLQHFTSTPFTMHRHYPALSRGQHQETSV